MSKIFKLDWKDLLRGAVVTVLAIVFAFPIDQLVHFVPFLDNQLFVLLLSALFGYLSKNLLTDDSGKLGGVLQIK